MTRAEVADLKATVAAAKARPCRCPRLPAHTFGECVDHHVAEHIGVLNQLEPHLGCVVCRAPLTDGRCNRCQGPKAT